MDYQPEHEAAAPVRGLTPLSRVLNLIACVLLFAMMLITFFDVVGRYVFSSPLPAAYEIVSLLMPAIIFCALPMTVLREGHVTVDLLDSFIPAGVARIQSVLVNLISGAALGLITWRLAVRSMDQRTYQEVTDELFLELWPFSAAMSILCAVATLAFVANVWLNLTQRKSLET